MRNIDTNLLAELSKEILQDFFLLELNFTSHLYYTTLDRPLVYNTNRYEPMAFTAGDVKIASVLSVDKISIEIDNAGLQFSQHLLSEDQRGKWCKLLYGVLLTDQTVAVSELFYGYLGAWTIEGDSKARLTIVNEFIFWAKKALRSAASSCPWVFKLPGGECGYAGSGTWCDQSWDHCVSLGNSNNFGGNPMVNVTAEKKIWWGKLPK
jgi:hypothetical protein